MKDFFMYLFAALLYGVVAIPLVLLVLHISGWYKSYITMRVEDRIGWWLLSSGADMLDYIQNKCVSKYIDKEYLIREESDRKIAFEIIEAFQKKTKHLYLNCDSFANRKLARNTYSEFFMYYYEKYLDEHDDYYFKGNRMYVEQAKENGCAKCSITEYGVVYNKLLYMARLFCERSPKLNKNNDYWSEGIKNKLDTKETTFYFYNL